VITTADVWKRMVPVGTNISIAFGVVFYGFSIYIRQDAAGAEFSTTVLSAAFGGSMLVAGVLAIPVGRYVDTHGVARLVGIGSVMAGLGLIGFGMAQQSWQVLAVWILIIGPAASAIFYEPIFTAINQWFPIDGRPLALAIVTVVGGSAGIIFIPIVQLVISSLGWRTGVMTLGLLPIVSGLLVASISLRGTATPDLGGLTARSHIRIRHLLADKRFVYFTAAMTLGFFGVQSIISHRLAVYEATGFNPAVTAGWAAAASAISLPGRWLAPMLAKRFRPTNVQMAALFLTGLGVALTISGTSTWEMIGHFVIFGLAFAAFLPLRAMVMSEWYDGPQYGKVMGAQWTVVSLIAATGPTIVGVLRDVTGSYRIPMIMVATVVAVSVWLTFLSGRAEQPTAQGTVSV